MPENEEINNSDDGSQGEGDAGGGVQQASAEIANRAQFYGWVPQEEFKGDKTKWVPADVFVKRAEEILPIARSMNRKLEADLTMTKKELAEMRKTVKAVIQAHKKAADGGYESQVAQIEKEQIEAVASADSEKWAQLEQAKKKLAKPEEIPFEEKSVAGDANPVVVQWKKDNPWYDTDPELGTYADSVSNFISTRSPGLAAEDFLDRVKKEVEKRFPEKFGNQRRRHPPSVDHTDFGGGGDNGGGNGKKSYSDLPTDAKAACDETIKQIKAAGGKMTREDYVRDYFA